MEPITLTLAIVALVSSTFSLFIKKMKRCKASKCCEVEMRSEERSEHNEEVEIVPEIISLDGDHKDPAVAIKDIVQDIEHNVNRIRALSDPVRTITPV
jgi:hypothetical protein